MISGRRAIDKNQPSGEHNLVEWAKPYLSNKRRVFRIMDPRLEGQYSHARAQAAAALAMQCLSMESRCRPNMDEVVKALEQLQESKDMQRKGGDHKHHHVRNSGQGRSTGTAGGADGPRTPSAYPRPTASLLGGWYSFLMRQVGSRTHRIQRFRCGMNHIYVSNV